MPAKKLTVQRFISEYKAATIELTVNTLAEFTLKADALGIRLTADEAADYFNGPAEHLKFRVYIDRWTGYTRSAEESKFTTIDMQHVDNSNIKYSHNRDFLVEGRGNALN